MSDAVSPTVFSVCSNSVRSAWFGECAARAGAQAVAFDSMRAFLRVSDRRGPAVALVEAAIPSTFELLAQLRGEPAALPVLVLTESVEFNAVVRAFRLGAMDILQLPIGEQFLVERIVQALDEDRERSRRRWLYRRLSELVHSLTPRERQVMHGVVDGGANKQIAADLGISEKTVEVHRHKVMLKMDADSLADLVRKNVIMEQAAAPLSLRG